MLPDGHYTNSTAAVCCVCLNYATGRSLYEQNSSSVLHMFKLCYQTFTIQTVQQLFVLFVQLPLLDSHYTTSTAAECCICFNDATGQSLYERNSSSVLHVFKLCYRTVTIWTEQQQKLIFIYKCGRVKGFIKHLISYQPTPQGGHLVCLPCTTGAGSKYISPYKISGFCQGVTEVFAVLGSSTVV
jgi:hypothetical protein